MESSLFFSFSFLGVCQIGSFLVLFFPLLSLSEMYWPLWLPVVPRGWTAIVAIPPQRALPKAPQGPLRAPACVLVFSAISLLGLMPLG